MATNDYRFESNWRVLGTPEEVTAILTDAKSLPRWWPSVYLDVQETGKGVYALHTRGGLPYTLRWSFRVVESRTPLGFTLEAWGDLTGRGVWTFRPDGDWTSIHYLWTVQADQPMLRRLSFLLKPIFEANHRWAMARGEESLVRELVARRASG